jgi:hypothetical protein
MLANMTSKAALTIVLALTTLMTVSGRARAEEPRQFYGKWKFHTAKKYYYREYYFKSNPDDSKYKHQYVIYKPSMSKSWVYWYNPQSKKYWARCATVNHSVLGNDVKAGADIWCLLPDGKKKDKLQDCKDEEEDFTAPKKGGPPIPGATDGGSITCVPPDDLPTD